MCQGADPKGYGGSRHCTSHEPVSVPEIRRRRQRSGAATGNSEQQTATVVSEQGLCSEKVCHPERSEPSGERSRRACPERGLVPSRTGPPDVRHSHGSREIPFDSLRSLRAGSSTRSPGSLAQDKPMKWAAGWKSEIRNSKSEFNQRPPPGIPGHRFCNKVRPKCTHLRSRPE